jgi:ribosomal protein L37E
MRFFLFNILAACILIGARVLGHVWISRQCKQTKMKNYGRCARCGYPVRQCICFRYWKRVLIFIAFLAIVSCKKSVESPAPLPTTAKVNVRFFSTNAVTSTKVITAKVSGTDYGRVTYAASQPACSAAGFGMVQLVPGVYNVDYIDPSNTMANKQVSITVPQGATTCVFFDLK